MHVFDLENFRFQLNIIKDIAIYVVKYGLILDVTSHEMSEYIENLEGDDAAKLELAEWVVKYEVC